MKKVHFAVIQRDVTDWKHNQTGSVLMEKGKPMLISDGYALSYHKSRNQIVISLPQTYATITNTAEQPVDRRTDVEETDLWVLLNIAQLIFHKGVGKDNE